MQSAQIQIAHRSVGPAEPPLVIAELGINHEGSLETAREMVDAAARAGVEVLKHQTHVVDDEMSSAARQVIPGNASESIYDIMRRCALSEDNERRLRDYVHDKGMVFISTPFSRAAADRLASMDVPAFKIGSGECNNYPLLRHIAGFGKPVILSTGMNTIESVRKAVAIFDEADIPVALLHTTNLYPTPPHLVRLGAMTQLADAFPGKVYGLSDHTTNNLACIAAVALGASILERHFTDRRGRTGPDIVCSMDESDCRDLIAATRIVHLQRGGTKEPAPEEQITANFAFATVVSIARIAQGEALTRTNLWVKRPGTGSIPAEKFEALLGRRARHDIEPDTHISMSDVL